MKEVKNSVFSRNIGKLAIHLNFGYVSSGSIEEKGVTTYAGGIEYPLVKQAVFVSEVTAESKSAPVWEGLIGAYLPISGTLTVDGGLGRGLNQGDNSSHWTIGLTCGF